MNAQEIIDYMESLQNDEQRKILMGFFKTGPGEYGESDEFLGLKVPQTREVVKATGPDFPLTEVPELLLSRWHEVRLCGFLILVSKFEKLATKRLEKNPDAITSYLQAVLAARTGDASTVTSALANAIKLDPTLADRAANDYEFVKYANAVKSLLK